MKIIEKDDEIFMRDVPATNWAYGFLLLSGALLFGISTIGISRKASSQSNNIWQVVSFIIAAVSLYWSFLKLASPIITTVIKPVDQTIEVVSRKFLIVKKTSRFSFSQIKRAETVRRKPDRAYLYFSVLTLFDDSQIDLESSGDPANTINRIPPMINKLLKKHKSSLAGRSRKRGGKAKE